MELLVDLVTYDATVQLLRPAKGLFYGSQPSRRPIYIGGESTGFLQGSNQLYWEEIIEVRKMRNLSSLRTSYIGILGGFRPR